MFSDKTGTLTQNIMKFKCFSVGRYSYGKTSKSVKINQSIEDEIELVDFEDPNFYQHYSDPQHPNYQNI